MGNDKEYIWKLEDIKNIPKNGYKVFSCFSCGGGSSMGYKLAGYEVLGNCEIDPKINEMYIKNHHPKYNFLMGVQDFYKEENRKNIPEELFNLDVLDGSPPCFAAGTKIKTIDGYKEIEHIRRGDKVFTHRGRYQEVYNLMSKKSDDIYEVKIKGINETIIVTGNHPFYVEEESCNKIWKRVDEINLYFNKAVIPTELDCWKVADFESIKKVQMDKPITVYNISVALDESYTVYGVAVHNCSTFSMAGSRENAWGKEKKFKEGQVKQVLSDLFFDFIQVTKLLKPKVVVAENVKGMVAGNAKGYVNLIYKEFDKIGYDVQLFCLNSATMGVPQRRERVFFICRRKDLCMPKIQMSFKQQPIRYGEFAEENYIPFNEETLLAQRWKKRRNSDRRLADTIERTENGKISQFNQMYVKKNEVPATLMAGSRPLRFDKPGFITDRDLCIIATFPIDYDFMKNDARYVCGMSVPPFMMRGVAKSVAEQLLPYAKDNDN